MRFAADKLVYVDFNDIIFEDLYIGKDDKSKSRLFIKFKIIVVTLRQQLIKLNDLIRVVFVKTPKRYFKEMLNTLNQTFIDGVLRYLMLLSSVGH